MQESYAQYFSLEAVPCPHKSELAEGEKCEGSGDLFYTSFV
jgi:hypothetical protein